MMHNSQVKYAVVLATLAQEINVDPMDLDAAISRAIKGAGNVDTATQAAVHAISVLRIETGMVDAVERVVERFAAR